MNGYQEPHYSDGQVYWDIDDAITCLIEASKAVRNGEDAKKKLEDAAFSVRQALANMAVNGVKS